MTTFQAIILGIVQGITEYLPVSSSAHLVLVPAVLKWDIHGKEAFIFDVLVQMGTLLGVLIYFSKDLIKITRNFLRGIYHRKPFETQEARIGWYVIIATLPATFFGLLLKDRLETFFDSPKAALVFLLFTGLVLILGEYFGKQLRNKVKLKDSVLMGFSQSLALFPGMSRSGTTISMGMLSGLTRSEAAKFSFLMSIPVMFGAAILALKDLLENEVLIQNQLSNIIFGFAAAAISGYIVIAWFLTFLKKQSLIYFAVYCLLVGFLGLTYLN